jgi:hypothetical protein
MTEIDLDILREEILALKNGIPVGNNTDWARNRIDAIVKDLDNRHLTEFTVYRDVEEYINVLAADEDEAEQIAAGRAIEQWTRTIKDQRTDAD